MTRVRRKCCVMGYKSAMDAYIGPEDDVVARRSSVSAYHQRRVVVARGLARPSGCS